MPVSAQVARLQRELAARFGAGPVVRVAELDELQGAEREAALDAIVATKPSPFVLFRGALVCTGPVDFAAVLDAVSRAPKTS
jgi:hypothetical protein